MDKTKSPGTIKRFEIDHTELRPGLYVLRHNFGTTTFDLRFVRPNQETCISPQALHTLGHLGEMYFRNQENHDIQIIYFGPMGSRTGFYLVISGWENPAKEDSSITKAVKSMLKFIVDYEGKIPGATKEECGNYKEHNLPEAKSWAAKYLHDLSTKPHFKYPDNERGSL